MKSLKEIIQVLNDCCFSYVNALKRRKDDLSLKRNNSKLTYKKLQHSFEMFKMFCFN